MKSVKSVLLPLLLLGACANTPVAQEEPAPVVAPAPPEAPSVIAEAAAATPAAIALPEKLNGKATVLAPTDPDYARAVIANAIKPAGQGGVSEGIVIKTSVDIPVYRMWSGPTKKDSRGNTNRMGSWWSYDAPHGPVAGYRTAYEICDGWNDLTWVATCTLKAGAVVVIGPGQSVSAETCGPPSTQSFPANATDWQLYLDKAYSRAAELSCPPESDDYEADPADISKHKAP